MAEIHVFNIGSSYAGIKISIAAQDNRGWIDAVGVAIKNIKTQNIHISLLRFLLEGIVYNVSDHLQIQAVSAGIFIDRQIPISPNDA